MELIKLLRSLLSKDGYIDEATKVDFIVVNKLSRMSMICGS